MKELNARKTAAALLVRIGVGLLVLNALSGAAPGHGPLERPVRLPPTRAQQPGEGQQMDFPPQTGPFTPPDGYGQHRQLPTASAIAAWFSHDPVRTLVGASTLAPAAPTTAEAQPTMDVVTNDWSAAAPTTSAAQTASAAQTPSAVQAEIVPALPQEPVLEEHRATPLRMTAAPARANIDWQAVESRARQMVREGFDLAGRGAAYSARQRFYKALALIAQARDIECGQQLHMQRLADARQALADAEDFVPRDSQLSTDIDVAHLIGVHATPVLHGYVGEVAPATAVQAYLEYAQKQMEGAVAPSAAGSLALYGMGKTLSVLAEESADARERFVPQAIALHRAALGVDAHNFLAANELGVVLARAQQWREARPLLAWAAQLQDSPQIWNNLATVHLQLGETQLAQSARERAELAASATPRLAASPLVQWTTPDRFANVESPIGATWAAPVDDPAPSAASTTPPPQTASGLRGWLPWMRR